MIDFLVAITREAGERVLIESRRIRGHKEGGGNWVTQADLASEEYLVRAIHQAYSLHKILTDPGYKVLTEESNVQILHPVQEPHLWVIDPLDGTTNFAFQLPMLAVSVAYIEKGVTQCGAIYDPYRRELFWATRGGGAFLNNEPIHVRRAKTFTGSLVNVGSPYKAENFIKTYPMGQVFHQKGARIVNLGTAALECAYVACGRLSLFYETGLKPWDIAAGKLIVEEAEGTLDFIRRDAHTFQFYIVVAGNSALVRKAKRLISEAL